ncbi:uncharacterized protein LOC132639603 [Lycium barbarum]|uniref:uncharacterized protein LOC132639603 n=1 Tax=Lycium barbarum TaxID=112863 RepID=UPI00293F1394|nr:uncharacterized protein LOC132639603 [Lycium barbarum]
MRHHELEFAVGDKVFLKVSPMKGVMQLGTKGKISPHFIDAYEIVRRIGKVAYELKLPSGMAMVHPVFHISILRFYKPDPSHIWTHEEIEVNEGFSYEEEPVQILDRQMHVKKTDTEQHRYMKQVCQHIPANISAAVQWHMKNERYWWNRYKNMFYLRQR